MKTLFEKRSGGTVARLDTPSDVETLLQVFERIAGEEGWQPGNRLRAYPDTAHHLAVRVGGVVAGGAQVALPDAAGRLPYLAVWPDVELEADGKTAHVTVLALRREYRGRLGLFLPLCVEVWRFCAERGIEAILLEATPAMLARYVRLGFPLETVGGLRPHWGEECYLCRMDMRTVAGSLLLKALRSDAYRQVIRQACRLRASAVPAIVEAVAPALVGRAYR